VPEPAAMRMSSIRSFGSLPNGGAPSSLAARSPPWAIVPSSRAQMTLWNLSELKGTTARVRANLVADHIPIGQTIVGDWSPRRPTDVVAAPPDRIAVPEPEGRGPGAAGGVEETSARTSRRSSSSRIRASMSGPYLPEPLRRIPRRCRRTSGN